MLGGRVVVGRVRPYVCGCPQRLNKGIRSPGNTVSSRCDGPNVGAGNSTLLFWKSSKCF